MATKAKSKTKAKKSTTKKKPKAKANAAFMSPMTPSPALAAVVGTKPLARTQVVKKLWEYIKSKKLQDPKNRRNIRPDELLSKIFSGKSAVSMFEMAKYLNKHLKKA